MRNGGRDQEERTFEIDVQHKVPLLFTDLACRSLQPDACGVDENVQAAAPLACLVHHFPASGDGADVERQADRVCAGGGDLRHGLVEFRTWKVGERDPLAVSRKAKTGRQAHSPGAACDQDRPASPFDNLHETSPRTHANHVPDGCGMDHSG